MEIELVSAKIVLPFCLYHYAFENGTKLVFSRKDKDGWNVYDPSRQKFLFEQYYGSIVYLNKRDSYIVIDDKNIGIANSNGQIIRELPKEEINYIYDQSYFYGEYCLYDFDGNALISWPNYIRKVIYDKEESCDTVWWSTYIDPYDNPQKPPFTKMGWGKILFFICRARYCDSVLDLQGKIILGPVNSSIDDEYDKANNKLIGFAHYAPQNRKWKHFSLEGEFLQENSVMPSHKDTITTYPINHKIENAKFPAKAVSSIKEIKENSFLFFDTETTGLPRDFDAPISDLENWPRLVQLSWIVSDSTGTEFRLKDFIVRPDGFTIPEDSSKVHGITTEIAMREGSLLQNVLSEFVSDLEAVDVIVGHNVEFDKKIVGAEFIRCNFPGKSLDKPTICTMKSSTDYCEIPGKYGYKWPTLQELHNKLFGEGFEDAHNSLNDIKATKKCFFELKKRNVI